MYRVDFEKTKQFFSFAQIGVSAERNARKLHIRKTVELVGFAGKESQKNENSESERAQILCLAE